MTPSPSTTPGDKETALLTGSTSGIGLHLAREFAARGHPLVLVAPAAPELENVAGRLAAEFQVAVHTIARDLRQENAAAEIHADLVSRGVAVRILVNNAGFGRGGRFLDIALEDDIGMIRLNIEAVVRLTKFFLPDLLAAGRGRVLNLASVAGFEPGPLMAVYHATKAFVLSWSEALATELADTPVTVTALCPGPVDTDFFPKAGLVESQVFQNANVMAPQQVAQAAYEALIKGERLCVPGAMNKALVFSRRMMPLSAQARLNEKLYEPADTSGHRRERGDIEDAAAEKPDKA